ncbi:50S ribosomal protein L22 [archaeon]|jgi:large subunit ribosomal protein L22|nr:50S ribosomal protein L22 [archaeon]MBT3730908.1 50S ribosomal protein L22 [archaeon]MBT4669853.1 50S ribosomal protein L22 [archaeon]MBT5030005.1 50S ribosomal protein L22 [archaeon]MBT5288106.1 50S ribosomal protein L22 [archaeon]
MTDEEHSVTARGYNLPISRKFSVEVANFIRYKPLTKAKTMIVGVIAKKVAVPIRIYNRDQAHKKGKIAAGKYPVKIAENVLMLLNSAEMNAVNKGLDTDSLFIKNIIVNKGSSSAKAGRIRGRVNKRTHIEITLEEKKKRVVKKKEVKKK